ncbi:MAG: hypothetical protein C4318_03870 [Acidimicrobiia bacterium]
MSTYFIVVGVSVNHSGLTSVASSNTHTRSKGRDPMRRLSAASLLIAVLLLVGCGGQKPQASQGTTQGGSGSSITVEATEFAFKPKEISTSAGTKTIVLSNKGSIEHDLTIDSLNVHLPHASPNSTQTTTVDLKPGKYEFYCSVPGHKEAGMIGTLTVS